MPTGPTSEIAPPSPPARPTASVALNGLTLAALPRRRFYSLMSRCQRSPFSPFLKIGFIARVHSLRCDCLHLTSALVCRGRYRRLRLTRHLVSSARPRLSTKHGLRRLLIFLLVFIVPFPCRYLRPAGVARINPIAAASSSASHVHLFGPVADLTLAATCSLAWHCLRRRLLPSS